MTALSQQLVDPGLDERRRSRNFFLGLSAVILAAFIAIYLAM